MVIQDTQSAAEDGAPKRPRPAEQDTENQDERQVQAEFDRNDDRDTMSPQDASHPGNVGGDRLSALALVIGSEILNRMADPSVDIAKNTLAIEISVDDLKHSFSAE